MIKIRDKTRYIPMFAGATALLTVMALIGNGTSQVAFAAVTCPVNLRVHGSTTVFPATEQAQGGFEATRPGTDQQNSSIGSGNGINNLLAGNNGVAPSSRPLNAGTETTNLWQFQVGRDAFVMAVKNSGNMSFINNITPAQVVGIYEGTITNWSALGGPSQTIIPRARILGSGSQPDFLASFVINATAEGNTIAASGQPRLTESSDMADAAANNDYQIAYTSLAFLDVAGLKALTLSGVAPSQTSVQNGTYPSQGRRDLYMIAAKTSFASRTDDSEKVLGDDLINYMLDSAGQAAVDAVNYVPNASPVSQRIPDKDVNLNGSISLSDLGAVTGKWGQSSTCNGWIRADVNNNAAVGLTDIGAVTGVWGNPGFVPPS